MISRSWIRNLFNRKTPSALAARRRGKNSKAARVRPILETLEDRVVLNNYWAATTADLITDIGLANAAGGTNTIALTAAPSSPYTLTAVNNTTDEATGLPVIAAGNSLSIVGNGDTIQRSTATGTPSFRLVDVAAGATLNLQNLTLQGGFATVTDVAAEYGGIYSSGGGILDNGGVLTIQNVVFDSDAAQGAAGRVDFYLPGDASGGALCANAGSVVSITDSTFSSNEALGGAEGPSDDTLGVAGGPTSNADGGPGVAYLSGAPGGLNGNYFLIASGPNATVFDNGAVDVLNGGSGMDWFFANLAQDLINGRHDSEIVENL